MIASARVLPSTGPGNSRLLEFQDSAQCAIPLKEMTSKRIGLVYWDTGFGIARDVSVVAQVIENLGLSVSHIRTKARSDLRERKLKFISQAWRLIKPYPLQIHLEQIHREQFRLASRNLFFPNPEFTDPNVFPITPQLSKICCKTHHAYDLIGPKFSSTLYTGFTSEDRFLETTQKDYRQFLHLAGKSDYKGTQQILNVWKRHPEWPKLTIIWSPLCSYGRPRRSLGEMPENISVINEYLPEEELLRIQNECGIHLCPSETEGFGHYINEARSTGAVIITTKGPPMEEFITKDTGFSIEAEGFRQQCMSTLYRIKEDALEKTIVDILNLPVEILATMGKRARQLYLSERKTFVGRTRDAIIEELDSTCPCLYKTG